MDTTQMFKALNALAEVSGETASLRMDINDNWYVRIPNVEIKKGAVLRGVGSHDKNSARAIEYTWLRLTNLSSDEYIVVDAMKPSRQCYRWNGFMWKTIDPEMVSK